MSDSSDKPVHQRVPLHIPSDFAGRATPDELDLVFEAYHGDMKAIVSILEYLYVAIPSENRDEYADNLILSIFKANRGEVQELASLLNGLYYLLPLNTVPDVYAQWLYDASKDLKNSGEIKRFFKPKAGIQGKPHDLSIQERDFFIIELVYLYNKKLGTLQKAYDAIDEIVLKCSAWKERELLAKSLHKKNYQAKKSFPKNDYFKALAADKTEAEINHRIQVVINQLILLSDSIIGGSYPLNY